MSKIEELIKNEKVEWKKLGEVCQFQRGNTITRKDIIEGDIPVIAGGKKPAYYHGVSNRDGVTIAVAGSGAYAGFVSYWEKPIFLSDAFSIEPNKNLNKRYLYYWLLNIQHKIFELKQGSSIPHVYGNDLGRFQIPVPSIKTQEKIVKILDKFTNYVTELKAELEARNKQYEFYRDMLLSEEYLKKLTPIEENNKIKYEKLSDFAKVTKLAGYEFTKYVKYSDDGKIIALRGVNVKKGKIKLDNVKYIDESDLSKLERSKLIKDDILFTYVGTIGEVGSICEDNKFYLAPNVAMIRIKENYIKPKYLLYLLQSFSFRHREINKWLETSSMKSLTMENIRKFNVTIPPIHVQNKIVSILDKFDKLVNDINDGLPKEISLRQKQYEYYRQKLLAFPKEH